MLVIEYRIGSFVRTERAENPDIAFAKARAIWAQKGCEYVFVRQGDGEQITVRRGSKRPWLPSQPERRQRPR